MKTIQKKTKKKTKPNKLKKLFGNKTNLLKKSFEKKNLKKNIQQISLKKKNLSLKKKP